MRLVFRRYKKASEQKIRKTKAKGRLIKPLRKNCKSEANNVNYENKEWRTTMPA